MIYYNEDWREFKELMKALAVVLVFSLCILFHVVSWFTSPRYESEIFDTSSHTMY